MAAYLRLAADLTRREMPGGSAATLGLFAGFGLAPRQVCAQGPVRPMLLTNLRLFDGTELAPRDDVDILIQDGRVTDLPSPGHSVRIASGMAGSWPTSRGSATR